MNTLLTLLALSVASVTAAPAATSIPSRFTLIISASDPSINGSALYATNNDEVDIFGVLQPVQFAASQDPTPGAIFYFDSATGNLVTDSFISGDERIAYTLYSNLTSSLRFDVEAHFWEPVYSPNFTIADDGTFSAGRNLTWAWCPIDVGDGWYLPGSITLGPVYPGCEAVDRLIAVDASS